MSSAPPYDPVVAMRAELRTRAMQVLRDNPRVRRLVRHARTAVLAARYRWLGRGAVDPHFVVFESFGGRRYAGSPRAVYEAMLGDPRFAGYRFGWALQGPVGPLGPPERWALDDARTSVVAVGTADYHRAFGRARVWVTNSIVAPELVPHGQLYVQTWHGTGIKRIGLDLPAVTASALNAKAEIDHRYRTEAAKIDVFVSPSPFGTTVFSGAFGLPAAGPDSPFVEIGNPRNDALVRATPAQVAAARARWAIADGVRAVLYAPTFRDDDYDAGSGYRFHQPFDLGALHAALGPAFVLLVRSHYLISAGVDVATYGGFVRDVSDVDEVNALLLASDVLVTDYSSVCFDYALLDRPIVFHVPDQDRFERDLRGFYFPIEDLPGPVVTTQAQLVEALLRTDDPARARRRQRRAQMCPHDDGHATGRLLDEIVRRR